jgi:hypothetical protein
MTTSADPSTSLGMTTSADPSTSLGMTTSADHSASLGMTRSSSSRVIRTWAVLLLVSGAAPLAAQDTTFAGVQARGRTAMGVDQYTSTHRFDALPDGGRIELQRESNDSVGVATIRAHIRAIAKAFESGDFSTPAFVHMRMVPGTDVMAAKRAHIAYEPRDLPRGAELRIRTTDPAAIAAIHRFMAFQRSDHHAGGESSTQPTHHH